MAELKEVLSLAPLVEAWKKKINASREDPRRVGFIKTARMCHEFFAGSMGMMWDEKFRSEFMSGTPAPKFRITVAKAFELVSIFGPSIMWDYPGRVVRARKRKPLSQEVFLALRGEEEFEGLEGTEGDPYQEYVRRRSESDAFDAARCQLMNDYLSYTAVEQYGGGLIFESHLAITESLVKGAGLLWVTPYQHPGGKRTLTGCFYDSIDNLYIDPGCQKANLIDANWVARKRVMPYWKVERMFDLPAGFLKSRATLESPGSIAVNDSPEMNSEREAKKTHDLICWYEVYSKEGTGCRAYEGTTAAIKSLDKVVGDFAFFAICPGVEFPLNMPPKKVQAANREEILSMAEWPVPYYKTGAWPFARLTYHDVPNSPWPLAPLSMGLGELVFMNVVMSSLVERVYEGCRNIGVVAKSIANDVKEKLEDASYSGWIEIPDALISNKSIGDYLQYIGRPTIDGDVFNMLDRAAMAFDKRVGLSDLLYGLNPGGKVSRSAADITIKSESVNVRPDWMRRRAESWQSNAADLERIAAYWAVDGSSLSGLLDDDEVEAWEQLISEMDPERFHLQFYGTVEANSIAKPNKFKDNANIRNTIGYILPILRDYFMQTGDSGPLNGYLRTVAEAMEQNPDPWMVPSLARQAPGSVSTDEAGGIQGTQEGQQPRANPLQNEVEIVEEFEGPVAPENQQPIPEGLTPEELMQIQANEDSMGIPL